MNRDVYLVRAETSDTRGFCVQSIPKRRTQKSSRGVRRRRIAGSDTR
ncbi:MAG: hypothetical protein LBG87_09775 [Spirochaetaceae bacterium]|nr:hypothetical protein [Spirochaetaceae bacterium]